MLMRDWARFLLVSIARKFANEHKTVTEARTG